MEKKKDLYFQFLRAVCVIAVICVHCVPFDEYPQFTIIFRQFINFPVAFFFFISAYFARQSVFGTDAAYKRLSKLFFPFIIWNILYWIYWIMLNHQFPAAKITVSFILGNGPGFHLYYLVVMFQFIILTPYILKVFLSKNSLPKILLLFMSLSALLAVYYVNYHDLRIKALYQSFFLTWGIFWFFGLNYENITSKFRTKMIVLCCLVVALVFSVFEAYKIMDITGSFNFAISQIKLSSFIYSLFLIVLMMKLRRDMKENSIMVIIGNYSFGIYLVHVFILNFIKLMPAFTGQKFLLAVFPLRVILTLFISLAIVIAANKILPKKIVKIIGFS